MIDEKCSACGGEGYLEPECADGRGRCDDYPCGACNAEADPYLLGFAAGIAAAAEVLKRSLPTTAAHWERTRDIRAIKELKP